MAEQGTTNISMYSMAGLVGLSQSNISLKALCEHANINKWSFYRSRPIQANSSTKKVEFGSQTTNFKLGDFRRYDHVANTPAMTAVYPSGLNWGPGGTTMTVTIIPKHEQLNVLELTNGSTPYYTVRYYYTSAARASETGYFRTYTTAMTMTGETPPTGHTNDQTSRPSGTSQILTDTAVPTTGLTKPNDTIYTDCYISDISGNVLARFDNGYNDINTHEYAQPYVAKNGLNKFISGYTSSYIVVNNSSSACAGADQTMTQGSQSASFYIHLVGLVGSTWYRLGATSITLRMKIGSTYYNMNTSSLSAFSNTQETTSNFWSTSDSWNYDDIGQVEIQSVSGVSQGGVCTP